MDDELLNIKNAIIQGKSTYTYSDTDIMMDIITNQPMFLQMIKFEKMKGQEENLEEPS